MRKLIVKWMVWLVALGLCAGIAGNALAASNNQGELQKLIQKTRQELNSKKKKEQSVLSNLTVQQKSLVQLEQNFASVKTQLSQVQDQYSRSKQELQGLESNLQKLEVDRSNRQELLNDRLTAIYKHGPQAYLEILLSARNFADMLSKFSMVAYIVRNDLKNLDELQTAQQAVQTEQIKVKQKTIQVASEFKKVAALKDQVAQKQQQVAVKVSVTKTELAKLQSDRAKLERALAEYEATSRQLESTIRKEQQGTVKGALGSGTMIWPAMSRGPITSTFGWRYHPILKVRKYHNGQDIAIPTGTPVKAADRGVILVSSWQGGYGNFVAIDHGNGISTCYGHNSRLVVRVGEKVAKGQIIAYSGSTGLSTGPHLHFEVRVNGTPVDPMSYLP